MRHPVYTLVIIGLISLCNPIFSQVKTKIFKEGIPTERINTNIKSKEIIFDATEEIERFKKEMDKDGSSLEYLNKFAHPIEINVNFIEKAEIVTLHEYTLYSLTLKARNALNLSLTFNKFILSTNAILSIYNNNELTDSIIAKENNPFNLWATRVYQGDKITLLLTVPNNELGKSILNISTINYGVKEYGGSYFGNPGGSAECNINVACTQGDDWENERNAVALLLVNNGQSTCSGTLIRNTCNTNIPYVLTAQHCLVGNLQNWVFQY